MLKDLFKNKKILWLIGIIYLLGMVYLVIPEPVIPNLQPGLKSIEPGDTVQLPGVWAYYTDLSRQEAIAFFQQAYSVSPWGIPLLTDRLNHPPEYARETIIDTLFSNFYEELNHPLKESLFISGWIPSQDELYLTKSLNPITEFTIDGQVFKSKITLYHVASPLWARLIVWTGIVMAGAVCGWYLKEILTAPWLNKR